MCHKMVRFEKGKQLESMFRKNSLRVYIEGDIPGVSLAGNILRVSLEGKIEDVQDGLRISLEGNSSRVCLE